MFEQRNREYLELFSTIRTAVNADKRNAEKWVNERQRSARSLSGAKDGNDLIQALGGMGI